MLKHDKTRKTCSKCGYFRPPIGRPKILDDKLIRSLRYRHKWSVIRIAEQFGVTRQAIMRSLSREHPKRGYK